MTLLSANVETVGIPRSGFFLHIFFFSFFFLAWVWVTAREIRENFLRNYLFYRTEDWKSMQAKVDALYEHNRNAFFKFKKIKKEESSS